MGSSAPQDGSNHCEPFVRRFWHLHTRAAICAAGGVRRGCSSLCEVRTKCMQGSVLLQKYMSITQITGITTVTPRMTPHYVAHPCVSRNRQQRTDRLYGLSAPRGLRVGRRFDLTPPFPYFPPVSWEPKRLNDECLTVQKPPLC